MKSIAAMALVSLLFPADISAESVLPNQIAGTYWAVQEDMMYGEFQHQFTITADANNNLVFTDYPILEAEPIKAVVDPATGELVFANGQRVYVNSYGDTKHLWSAAPDDPLHGYDIDIDSEIRMQYDNSTGIISWDAPFDEHLSYYHRFLMVGGKYYDYDDPTNWTVAGMYHFIKVRLHPVNAQFTATRLDDGFSGAPVDHPVKVAAKDDKALVYGIINLDHGKAITLSVNKENGSFVASDALLCDDEDYGEIYMKPLNDDSRQLCGSISYDGTNTVIEFEPFKAEDYEGTVTAGEFENAKVVVPFDLLSEIATSSVNTLIVAPNNESVKYFNLQGVEIDGPVSGVYIEVRGSNAVKRIK